MVREFDAQEPIQMSGTKPIGGTVLQANNMSDNFLILGAGLLVITFNVQNHLMQLAIIPSSLQL